MKIIKFNIILIIGQKGVICLYLVMLYYTDYFESVIMYFKRLSSTSSSKSNENVLQVFHNPFYLV